MSIFEVVGGKRLSGEIFPQGAKNEALQVISAVLLTAEEVLINNIPDIIDVNLLIELLKEMNVKVNRIDANTCSFKADDVNVEYLQSNEYHKKKDMRHIELPCTAQNLSCRVECSLCCKRPAVNKGGGIS